MTASQPARLPEITRMLLGSPPDGGPPPGQALSLGAVCLDGSTVGGRLVLSRALLRCDTGPAVRASRLVVRSGVTGGTPPGPGLTAIGAGADGAVCLASADITGPLALPGATLINASGRPWPRPPPGSTATCGWTTISWPPGRARPAACRWPVPRWTRN